MIAGIISLQCVKTTLILNLKIYLNLCFNEKDLNAKYSGLAEIQKILSTHIANIINP